MTKKNVLWISGIGGGLFIFFLLALLYNFCGSYRIICKEIYGFIAYPFSPLPLIFILSLITYKMREEIFQAWWNFARWFVPIIIIITYLINSSHQQSGFAGVAQGAFETLILIILYAVFIIVSSVRIILVVRKIKK